METLLGRQSIADLDLEAVEMAARRQALRLAALEQQLNADTRDHRGAELPCPAEAADLSWLDYSYPADLSADGKTVLFDEEGVGGGVQYGNAQELTYAVYIRNTDGSPAIRLGEGAANAISPDQKWVIVQTPGSPEHLRLLPTGAGETQPLTNDSINHQWARWFPDGKRFAFSGNEPGHGARLYRKIFLEGNRRRFLPKESMQWRLRFRRMGSRSWGLAPITKDTSIPRLAASLGWSMAWSQEMYRSVGIRMGAQSTFTGPARCRPRFISWS